MAGWVRPRLFASAVAVIRVPRILVRKFTLRQIFYRVLVAGHHLYRVGIETPRF